MVGQGSIPWMVIGTIVLFLLTVVMQKVDLYLTGQSNLEEVPMGRFTENAIALVRSTSTIGAGAVAGALPA